MIKKSGFTIVELMIVLALSGVLITAIVSGFIVHKGSYERETSFRDMNINARIAMNHIKTIIRNAGLGCNENFNQSGSGLFEGAFRNASSVLSATNRVDGPDILTVVTGLRSRTRINGDSQGSVINVYQADGFDLGTGRYIFIAPSERNRYLEILNINNHSLTLSDQVNVKDGDFVFRINAYTITLDIDGQGHPQDIDGDGQTSDGDGDGIPDLYIYNNMEDLVDETVSEVAEGIEDIQFEYGRDIDGNGYIDEGEWVNDPGINEPEICAIRISILARTLRPDPNFVDQNTTYTIADHVINLDTIDENGIDSLYDHHYHRMLLVETVMIRNRYL